MYFLSDLCPPCLFGIVARKLFYSPLRSFTCKFFIPCNFFLSSLVFIVYNPIYALISLICLFLTAAFFLIAIGAEFLGMIYLIIYIGAIAILFLFVIMMFNLRELQDKISKVQDQDFFQISFTLYILVTAKFYQLLSENLLDIIGQNFSHNKMLMAKYFLISG